MDHGRRMIICEFCGLEFSENKTGPRKAGTRRMGTRRAECGLLRRAIWFPCGKPRTEEEPEHYKPCWRSADPRVVVTAADTRRRSPEEGQQ